ncbi:hypothetical protein QQ020_07705 [Fulvivirgaceae bacterium BMA12]|uniref:Uncharacterized protein n=1 Tax=Agaribacillus aureus TaxID=3051825 RepID=A0ABT8L4G8_9BACT|nr:hypothetical protein [Fulvivirgaceae bacterium BMA12]
MVENIPEIALVLTYLKQTGGDEIVKEAAKDLYQWVKGKLVGKSKATLEALEANPEDPELQEAVQKKITAAREADLIDATEFKAQLVKFHDLLALNDPQWLQQYKTIIKDSKNVVTDSELKAGGDIHIGDKHETHHHHPEKKK